MKFFSLETYCAWYVPFMEEEEQERVLEFRKSEHAAYDRRLEGLGPRFPAHLLNITHPYHVDDALLASVCIDHTEQSLKLTLRCGNIPEGYFDLILVYQDIEISREHKRVLIKIAQGTYHATRYKFDCYCHELDLTDDERIEHRFLFHPGVWFAIQASKLNFQRVDQPDRTLPPKKLRYSELPAPSV